MKFNVPHLHDAGAQMSKLAAIAFAMGLKDPYTQDHARRVAVYASRLSQRLGLTPEEVENIWLGGLLHDIGKIGLSAKIFSHTHSRLSADMQAEVRRHPKIGAAILKDFDFQTPVIDFVHYHHEKMDGTGYPYRLKSDQIPLGAKTSCVKSAAPI
jgi:putative nucleotidyltransferase with HDIG domain